MIRRLGLKGPTRGPFWKAFLGSLLRNPKSIRYSTAPIALYLHFGPFADYLTGRIRAAISAEERAGAPVAPDREEAVFANVRA